MTASRFWRRAADYPERVALVEPDGRAWTAGELLGAANSLVHGLRGAGLRDGDGVAVVLPNGADLIVAYLAAMQAGWYLTPVNHHLVAPEIAHIVSDSQSAAVIAHERFAESVGGALDAAGFDRARAFAVGDVEGCTPLSELTGNASRELPAERRAGAVMFYTSGTTGRPKGVRRPLPDTDPEDAAIPFLDLLGLFGISTSADDVHLCGSPLYHTAVLAFTASALHTGQRVVLMDRFSAGRMLELIEEHGVTNSHMVPTQFHRLLGLPDEERRARDVSSLRYVVHGAAPCPPEVKRRMIEWWGPVVYEYYGTTEGGGTIVTSQEWLERPGTVGRPWPGADIRILDESGAEVPRGAVGTVYIHLGPQGFRYYNDDAKTAESRRGDYFTVGDIGTMDDDGYLYLKERSANLIIVGGVNIYPVEIENALLGHPGVADAAVFGVPDADLGERVVAVVELRDAARRADEGQARDELLAHCAQQLARFKVPREVTFIDRMPRDDSGKLFKRLLRERHPAVAGAVAP